MFVCIVHSCIQYNTFFADINVFVQTEEPSDFTNIANISFLNPDFVVEESHFQNIPHNSIIILDDFSFKVVNKETKQNFLKVCNYILRHHNITLILIIHNLYSTNLSTEISLSPNIIIAYTKLGEIILR